MCVCVLFNCGFLVLHLGGMRRILENGDVDGCFYRLFYSLREVSLKSLRSLFPLRFSFPFLPSLFFHCSFCFLFFFHFTIFR